MRPRELITRTTSGSGLFQVEVGRMPTSSPVPTVDMGWVLVKISASGPIPTSMKGDQRPRETSTSFTLAASGEPGLTRDRLSPTSASRVARVESAASGSPVARLSTTRSSMLFRKVTPHAFTA